jgi:hypothetical protein
MKSAMTIKVEFLAGTAIEEAISEAKAKALTLDVAYMDFDFNGVKMSIGRNCCVKDAVNDFHKNLGSNRPYKIVCHS